jgi:hypothetical protein
MKNINRRNSKVNTLTDLTELILSDSDMEIRAKALIKLLDIADKDAEQGVSYLVAPKIVAGLKIASIHGQEKIYAKLVINVINKKQRQLKKRGVK